MLVRVNVMKVLVALALFTASGACAAESDYVAHNAGQPLDTTAMFVIPRPSNH